MTIGDVIFAVISGGIFISMILLVLFGQITVRKLRKNPETKDSLGISFASGWDIFNVAQALALPKKIAQRISDNSKGFEANPVLLYKHTTVFDRVLARIFYTLFILFGFSMIILVVLEAVGIFE